MQVKTLLAAAACAFSMLHQACACPPQLHQRRDNSNTSSNTSPLTIGTDGPADPATLGYTMNHFALVVNNITATRHFYGTILGMRHIFTYQASPTYTITYMSFSQGGKNGTGYQTGEELLRNQKNSEGLIEFLSLTNQSSPVPPTTTTLNTFSHVGLIVPDVASTQARMDQFGVPTLKRLGQSLAPGSKVADAFGIHGLSAEEEQAVSDGVDPFGFMNFLIVADPDGNVIEFQQQS